MFMKQNIGTLDKIIRLSIAAVILLLYFFHIISGTVAIVLLVLGVIFVVTSAISFCPLYWPFNISTKKDNNKSL